VWIITALLRLVALVPLVLIVMLPFYLFDSSPLIAPHDVQVFEDAETAKRVLKRFDPREMRSDRLTVVSASDDEISRSVSVVLARLVPARMRVESRREGIWIGGTADVPKRFGFFGEHINVEVVIAPSASGLEFAKLSIGSARVPAWLIRPAASVVIDFVVGAGKGDLAFESVRSVDQTGSMITVAFQPQAGLFDQFKDAAGRMVHRGNVIAIQAYYRRIAEVSRDAAKQGQLSFATYIEALFALAAERSASGDAIEENRAAILALARYFGDSRFELLLRGAALDDVADGAFSRSSVRLQGRHDWVQHFVTTAALQVAAGSDISNFVGEAKEIADADGPSGFSFTDIAADRAGVRFAEAATGSVRSATRIQDQLRAGVAEADFFPRVSDLPEGLSDDQFKLQFVDIGSPAYSVMISKIDTRIGRVKTLAR
jgi:hypothetical protein